MKINLDLGFTRLIISTARKNGLLRNQLAYVLATTFWETNRTMQPVKEAYWLSENWRKNNLRYYPWYGRGFVQLTWRENYEKAGKALGLDFISNPDSVMEPVASAKVLVVGCQKGWFTGKKLSDYITLNKSDFIGARRIVNGMDEAHQIAALAEAYEAELIRENYGVSPADIQRETANPWQRFIAALKKYFNRKD